MILFILACSGLWRLGGWDKAKWRGYRIVLIPALLALWYGYALSWWMLLEFIPASSIRLGYGAWDPEHDSKPSILARITKDREGSFIRLIYGLACSFSIGLTPAILTGNYEKFIYYVLGNGILEFLLNKFRIPDYIEEPLTGAGLASIILFI